MGSPPQTTWLGTGVTLGTGLTVISKLCGAPTQVPKVGVMLIVAVWGVAPVAVPTKFKPVLAPLIGKPTLAFVLVQANVLPAVALKLTAMGTPAQRVTLGNGVNTGTALTVALNVMGVPEQPFSTGVTVTTPVCVVWLGAVFTEILPAPEAEIPVPVLLFVQL